VYWYSVNTNRVNIFMHIVSVWFSSVYGQMIWFVNVLVRNSYLGCVFRFAGALNRHLVGYFAEAT